MRKFKQKHCAICNTLYTPQGSSSKYCSDECSKVYIKSKQKEYSDRYNLKQGNKVGIGSGGTTGKGSDNFMYSHGRCTFRRWAKERKNEVGICEHCGKDIKDAPSYEWVGHHIDHNPSNNVIENLAVLCKQCHQKEHECWKNFEGVTTREKSRRVDNNSKPLTSKTAYELTREWFLDYYKDIKF